MQLEGEGKGRQVEGKGSGLAVPTRTRPYLGAAGENSSRRFPLSLQLQLA